MILNSPARDSVYSAFDPNQSVPESVSTVQLLLPVQLFQSATESPTAFPGVDITVARELSLCLFVSISLFLFSLKLF